MAYTYGQKTKRRAGTPGTALMAPLSVVSRNASGVDEIQSEIFRGCIAARHDRIDDFDGSALDTGFWTVKDVSVGGTPTTGFVNPATAPGEWSGAFSSTSEAAVLGLFTNDILWIDSTKPWLFEARVKISAAPAATRFIFGLGSAYNATFDSVTRNAWFRVEPSNLSILMETDDNTTDTDDQDTAFDFVADTYRTLTIDGSQLGTILFYVDGVKVGSLAASAMTGYLQPLLLMQRDSGTATTSFTVDYVRVSVDRV
jgi:hypothetical protein